MSDGSEAFGGGRNAVRISVIGLFVLAVLYTVHFASEFIIPVLLAMFLNYLLSPVIRGLRRAHVPGVLSAAVLLIGLTAGLSYGAYRLSAPAATWISKAPEATRKVQRAFRGLQRPVQQVKDVSKSIEEATGLNDPEQPRVQIGPAPLIARLFGGTTTLVQTGITALVLAFLLLAPGDVFTDKLVALLRRKRDKEGAVRISHEIERQVSRYLLTVTGINATVGLITGLAMWALGMPDPALWGALAGLANFIPYLGPIGCVAVLSLASAITFRTFGATIAPPLVYYSIHFLESNVVTPLLLERWLAVNAVVSFASVLLLWLLLGIPGAIIAVPLLVVLKILCGSTESLRPLAAFLDRGTPLVPLRARAAPAREPHVLKHGSTV